MSRQQTAITRLGGVDDSVKASYMIALDIAKNMKSFSDGNFIKDCIIHAAQCVSPKTVNDFKKISLSRNTITRRVEDLSRNVESVLKEKFRTSVFYSLALDEGNDQTDTAQLAIFVRGVDSNCDVFEELLSLASLKDRAAGEDMFKALKERDGVLRFTFRKSCRRGYRRSPFHDR